MDGLRHAFRIPGAEVAADDHASAHGGAHEEGDHQKDQACGGFDGGKGRVPKEFADDPGVGGVVELLEELAQKNRQSKGGDDALRVPLGQQHGILPPVHRECSHKEIVSFLCT